jgi:glycosyltransferase involved in cell wall biosynthesis
LEFTQSHVSIAAIGPPIRQRINPEAIMTNLDNLPAVTVGICVRNGEEYIEACILSVLKLNYPLDRLEIIVVDNASEDKTAEIVSRYPLRLIHEPIVGRGSARNCAWKAASHDYIAFTDADCQVSVDWLIDLMPVFEDSNIGAVGGRIITAGDSVLSRFYEARRIVSNEEFINDYPFSKPFLATANAIFKRNLIKQCGGFSSEFIVAEDADLCWKISRMGCQIRFIPKGSVYHHHKGSLRGLFQQSINYGYSGIEVYLAHRRFYNWGYWIWLGLYYRLLRSFLKLLVHPLNRSADKKFDYYDFTRFLGLSIGRIKAAIKFGTIVL